MNTQLLYTACLDCGKKVTGDSIHTCLPQLKELTDEEIALAWDEFSALQSPKDIKDFARAILKKAQKK